ncbi:glycerol-3-phosphate dehydrogenase, partial [bacterium]|nr:glycerol-3-phosphate dehydrogenase [bacterium]
MKLTVLGPGCWGLTLAWLLNNNFDDITIWGRESDLNDDLLINKHCAKPLEIQLDKKVVITSDLKSAIANANIILSVVATAGVRPVCEQLKAVGINPDVPLVNASKGLELNSLMRMSEVIKDVLPNQRVVVLSGPTLAKEVLQGKPTAASVACEDIEVAEFVQKACNVPNLFRLYTNNDVIGVELGGSLKNVIAIASGFAHEMNLGDNCTGSLLTRGMAEIVRL